MHVRSDAMGLTTMVLQQFSTLVLVLAAFALVGATLGAAFGAWPWLALGGVADPALGVWVQCGTTLVVVALLGFLPSNARVRRLEVTNRDFHISMADVARAYEIVHRADRDGAFALSREFDQMRERIAWMRAHPDLQELEPDILELAAQMSVESRDLAAIYSTERVERAHAFLRQRQQEIEDYRQRIAMAQATVQEIKRWMQAIDVDEELAERQLERLQRDLDEISEGLEIVEEIVPENVVQIDRPASRVAPSDPSAPRPAPRGVPAKRQALLSSADEMVDSDLDQIFRG